MQNSHAYAPQPSLPPLLDLRLNTTLFPQQSPIDVLDCQARYGPSFTGNPDDTLDPPRLRMVAPNLQPAEFRMPLPSKPSKKYTSKAESQVSFAVVTTTAASASVHFVETVASRFPFLSPAVFGRNQFRLAKCQQFRPLPRVRSASSICLWILCPRRNPLPAAFCPLYSAHVASLHCISQLTSLPSLPRLAPVLPPLFILPP